MKTFLSYSLFAAVIATSLVHPALTAQAEDVFGLPPPIEEILVDGPISLEPGPRLIDDGDVLFSTQGQWTSVPFAGYQGDFAFSEPARDHSASCEGQVDMLCNAAFGPLAAATWSFQNLPSAQYEIWATWVPFPELASNATYRMYVNGEWHTTEVNQQKKPNKNIDGTRWTKIGTHHIGGNLDVTLHNIANGYVMADAVRLVKLEPKVSLTKEGPDVITPNSEVTYTFTITNNHSKKLNKIYITDEDFVTNGMTLVKDKSHNKCKYNKDDTAIVCGQFNLKSGESETVTLTGIAPDYSCPHNPVSNTASVELKSHEVTDTATHTSLVLCDDAPPFCPIIDVAEPPENCDYDWSQTDENGCPVPTLICAQPVVCAEPALVAPPPGCEYNVTQNEYGCNLYELICAEPVPVCPDYALQSPPEGCEYIYTTNEEGCSVPELICAEPVDQCPVLSIAEPEPGCDYVYQTDDNGCTIAAHQVCPSEVFGPVPVDCPAILLAQPQEGCTYRYEEDANGCTIAAHEVCPDPVQATYPLEFSSEPVQSLPVQ